MKEIRLNFISTENYSSRYGCNLKQKGHKVIPRQKLYHQCINHYEKIMKEPEETAIDENETETEEQLQTE